MAQRSQMNAKEKLDREIDLTNASKDELIEHLCKIIEYEVEKGEDADYDLVRECSDWLDELTEDEVTFTPEELERKLAQLKAGSESKTPVKICKKAKLKTFVRVALIAAVIFTISLVSLSAMAVNKGYGSAWEYVVNNLEMILGMKKGDVFEEKGVSIVKSSGTTYYDCIEDLLVNENLNIMLPDQLTTGVDIESLRIINESENKFTIYFRFSDNRYTYAIKNYHLVDLSTISTVNKENYNGISYYIFNNDKSLYSAVWQHNEYQYTVQSDNYDNLMIFIKNMKG